MNEKKITKWITVKCLRDGRGSEIGSPKRGHQNFSFKMSVSEKNKYFDWYKNSPAFKVVKEWEVIK